MGSSLYSEIFSLLERARVPYLIDTYCLSTKSCQKNQTVTV